MKSKQMLSLTDMVGNERHGISMSNETHHYFHETRGAQWMKHKKTKECWLCGEDGDKGIRKEKRD